MARRQPPARQAPRLAAAKIDGSPPLSRTTCRPCRPRGSSASLISACDNSRPCPCLPRHTSSTSGREANEQLRTGQIVVEHDVGRAQALGTAQCEQARIAGAGADQIHFAASSLSWASRGIDGVSGLLSTRYAAAHGAEDRQHRVQSTADPASNLRVIHLVVPRKPNGRMKSVASGFRGFSPSMSAQLPSKTVRLHLAAATHGRAAALAGRVRPRSTLLRKRRIRLRQRSLHAMRD